MAESNIQEMLTRKAGPLPVWAWIVFVAAGAGAFMIIQKNKQTVAGQPSNAQASSQGQFQSSQSQTTTDAQGNTTTTQYSATGQSPFGVPGYLTQQAYPMPYSLGDTYNNITTNTTVPENDTTTINIPTPPQPVNPPPPPQQTTGTPPPPPPPPAPQPNWWDPGQVWTVDPGNSLWFIAKRVLEARLGRPPSNGEIAGYWPQIYAANRGVIGGNPNLIHPGQNFVLP